MERGMLVSESGVAAATGIGRAVARRRVSAGAPFGSAELKIAAAAANSGAGENVSPARAARHRLQRCGGVKRQVTWWRSPYIKHQVC